MLSIYELERRRIVAIEMHAAKVPRAKIASDLGLHYETVSRWIRIHREGGLEAIRAKRRGRPKRERIYSDDNPETNGAGEAYDVDTDPRFASHRHPVEDMEPEEERRSKVVADIGRTLIAWLLGSKQNAHAQQLRLNALALITSRGVLDEDRIEFLARRLKKKNGKRITKQALNKHMSEVRRLLFDDLGLELPHLRDSNSREAMRKAAFFTHRLRREKQHYEQNLPRPTGDSPMGQ